MGSLKDVLLNVSKDLKRDALASCFVFPKTESLANDQPYVVYDNFDRLDLKAIRARVEQDVDFVAINIREDLLLVLEIIEEMKVELMLDKMDAIQIYRGGLDVLKIVIKGNKTGRCAYIEINDYKRRIIQLAKSPESSPYAYAIATGVFAVVLTILIQASSRIVESHFIKK